MDKKKDALLRKAYEIAESEEGQSYRPPTSFLDVLIIIFCVVLFGLVIGEQKKTSEYQVKIDMLKKELSNKKPAAMKPDPETPSLTIANINGRVSYMINSANLGSRTFKSENELGKFLERQRPAKLVIRVEQSVPSGLLQGVLLDCQNLSIMPFLSAASK